MIFPMQIKNIKVEVIVENKEAVTFLLDDGFNKNTVQIPRTELDNFFSVLKSAQNTAQILSTVLN